MIKILFICHGNICRSPMSEFIFKSLLSSRKLDSLFQVDSGATSREEIGNSVYPPARRELARHGISCQGKRARQVTAADYEYYDYILVAEQYNIQSLRQIFPEDVQGKIYRLLDFTEHPRDISDPWYHGNFGQTYQEIEEGCHAFLRYLEISGELNGFIQGRDPEGK